MQAPTSGARSGGLQGAAQRRSGEEPKARCRGGAVANIPDSANSPGGHSSFLPWLLQVGGDEQRRPAEGLLWSGTTAIQFLHAAQPAAEMFAPRRIPFGKVICPDCRVKKTFKRPPLVTS